MKKLIYLLVLMPFASFCQCPTWVGQSLDSAKALKNIAAKYLQFTLINFSDTTQKETYQFGDAKGFCTFKISVSQSSSRVGKVVKTTYGPVKSIFITGPADKIDKFVNEYFLPLLKPCSKSVSSTWIKSKGMMLVHSDYGEGNKTKLKFIQIQRQ